MKWTWSLIKDITLTVTGLGLITSQVFSPEPKPLLVWSGLALTGIGASFHVGSLMNAHIGSDSLPPPPQE